MTDEDARANLSNDSERRKEDDKLRWAALHLRAQIMKMAKTKTPSPATDSGPVQGQTAPK
jgi:hypothetical protein